jgi:hypothetical protein
MMPPEAILSREQRLRDVLGSPPNGTSWLDQIRREVDKAPALTAEQRNVLAPLLLPIPDNPTGPGSRDRSEADR